MAALCDITKRPNPRLDFCKTLFFLLQLRSNTHQSPAVPGRTRWKCLKYSYFVSGGNSVRPLLCAHQKSKGLLISSSFQVCPVSIAGGHLHKWSSLLLNGRAARQYARLEERSSLRSAITKGNKYEPGAFLNQRIIHKHRQGCYNVIEGLLFLRFVFFNIIHSA